MLLPVLLVSVINRITSELDSRELLSKANLVAFFICLVVYILLPDVPLIAIVGSLSIGSIDAIQRVGRIVAIKQYSNSEDVGSTVSLTLTAQFIAGGAAGALMTLFGQDLTPTVVLFITSLLFLLGFISSNLLPMVIECHSDSTTKPVSSVFEILNKNKKLHRSFWEFILLVTVFQGFFNISRVTLPAHVLGLSEEYVGSIQIVNSLAALLGAILFYKLSMAKNNGQARYALLSSMFFIVASSGLSISASYISYFFYIFLFELSFLKLQSEIVTKSKKEDMATLASAQYCAVYIGMMLAIFIGTLLVDVAGLLITSFLFAAIYYLGKLLILRRK